MQTIRLLKEKYLANAATVGDVMMTKLKAMATRHDVVTDVRGWGLMIGVELSRNRDAVIEECFRRGVLVLGAGPNTIRISPPLVVDEEQVECAVETLSAAISAVA
jgi:4-aminobutyrate aminotransferase